MPRKTKEPPARRRTEGQGPGGGTPADRLLRAWLDEDYDAFEDLAEDFIAGGRDGVLSAAIRRLAEKYDEDAVEEFAFALTELAEAAEGQEGFDFAELVLLPVLTSGAAPDPAPLASGLASAGVFPPEAKVAFAEGWRSAEAVGSLSPGAIRRVLIDIANGRTPADLPPMLPGDTTESGIVVLVGAVAFETEPLQDDPDAEAEVLTTVAEAQESERADAFDTWRANLDTEVVGGALILPLCPPSELADEIEALLEDADTRDPDLDEIFDFIETAQAEAGGEEVVARLAAREGGVELSVLTHSGRTLDSRVLGTEGGDLTVEDVRRAIEDRIAVVDGPA